MRWIKKEKGAALFLEASFVLPLTIMIIIFLVFAGSYLIQKNGAYARAQQAVSVYAQMQVKPNTQNIYILKDQIVEPSIAEYVEKAYEDTRLYGRLLNEEVSAGNLENVLEKNITSIIGKVIGQADATFEVTGNILKKQAVVNISYDFRLLAMLRYLGVNQFNSDIIKEKLTINAPILDNTEFIRNVDIAFDVMDFLAEKFGMKKKVNEVTTKINGFLEKIGVKK